ncbi:MAG: amino acid adenylation domain-containing protein [Candidatus Bathyarchaeota archaeon]|nr:amino acid adenylation domain-containing protein [Candidatus Termiticorpusculum sp.]MCL2868052.1 amino acid adenylation domain-containing protein [Candidatus Termiticorpusculum sp.]
MRRDPQCYPLSIPQKGIWYTEKFYSGTNIAGISATVRLKMPLDFSLLEQAINLVIEHNDSMRINVCMIDNKPHQFVVPYIYKKLEVKDFTATDDSDIYTWSMNMTKTPLFAENADLYRFVVLKIDANTCGYFVMLHHLISDAWSMIMVGNEIMRYYFNLQKGVIDRMSKPSYLVYLAEENVYVNSERYKKDATFWREQFETIPEHVGIKARKSNEIRSDAVRKSYVLKSELCHAIQKYSKDSQVSVFVILMSSFMLYLNRLTGSDDTVLGVAVHGRYNAEAKKTLGMFVSSIPFRFKVDPKDTYSTFIQKLFRCWLSVLRHQRYHIDHILQDMRNRFGEVTRLYDIVFSYQNAKFEQQEGSLQLGSKWHFNGHQNESLIINFNERDNDGVIMLDYDFLTDLFHTEDIDAMHDHYVNILWHALSAPSKQVKNIEIVSEKEKNLILNEFNDTAKDFSNDRTVLDFFEAQVACCPNKVAVLFEDNSLTYSELNVRANALAMLLRSKGVKRGSIVAMMLYRSFEMMIGILGIWKAGGAYLPIDPEYPKDRIEYMLKDSKSSILLTTASIEKQLTFKGEILQIDNDSYSADKCLENAAEPSDVAYVIYTSGSTGQAKGVMVEHRALVNRIQWMNRKYPLLDDDVILQKTTYTFDVSVWELVWWFFAGVKLVFLPPAAEKYPDKLIDAINSYQITTLHFVPSMLNAFLCFVDTNHNHNCLISSLRKVFASGEVLTPQQVNRFNTCIHSVSGARLYNLYGPTEAAIDVSYYDCPIEPDQRIVPIGKPIDNIQLYIVDKHMNLQPIGVSGELCIGGVGLAREYINKPELTTEKFVPNPFKQGERLYKTGDLVRWSQKGDIEYCGRMDFQVKIRGFRIELGDVQYHLEQIPSVRETVVTCFENPAGGKYLAAYYVSDTDLLVSDIRDFLVKRLPDYMIPFCFIRVDQIPLFSNGKVNVSLLPKPPATICAAHLQKIILPRNKTEALVMRVWSETLGINELSVTDNFFTMGGDSISAINMVCRMPTTVNVSKVYEYPVLADFARYYNEKDSSGILVRLSGEENATRSYILCPYGGGGAYTYLSLAKALSLQDPSCCVYAVNLPGHDYESKDGSFLPINDVAALILKETTKRVSGKIVIYSHCVGAALGVELVHLLELAKANIEAFFVGGVIPPANVGIYGWFFDPWMFVRDKRLLKFLISLGLSEGNVVQTPQTSQTGLKEMQKLLKAFRYDVRSYYRYFAKRASNKQKKLGVPIFSILGELDQMTKRSGGTRNWQLICDAPMQTIKIKGARHYFIKTHATELAEIMTRTLQNK